MCYGKRKNCSPFYDLTDRIPFPKGCVNNLDTLISNVTVVTMNEKMDVLFGAYIGITDGKISTISKTAPTEQPKTIVDGTGMVAIPGLVNCHTHLAANALRCCFDDLSVREALEQLLQREAKMDSRCAKAAATLGIAECLRFGITSISDLYYYPDATAQAAAEAGIKANIALSAYRFEADSEEFDFDTDPQCQELARVVEKWHNYDHGRIRIDCGIHAEYTGNHQLWDGISTFAQEKGLGMQLHLSETAQEAESCADRTGLYPAQLLDCHGMFSVPATVAGCAGLTPEERALLSRRKATAVITPATAAKNGSPATDVLACVKTGMNVALGTGGAHECGSMDMFDQIRAALQDARRSAGKIEAMPAQAVLMMATFCGARAQGRGEESGMLKEGMDADLVLVDFSAPHLIPCLNVLGGLAFCAHGGDVAMTMVRGNILYQNGQFPTLDLKQAVEELTTYAIPRLFAENKS